MALDICRIFSLSYYKILYNSEDKKTIPQRILLRLVSAYPADPERRSNDGRSQVANDDEERDEAANGETNDTQLNHQFPMATKSMMSWN